MIENTTPEFQWKFSEQNYLLENNYTYKWKLIHFS